MTGLTKANDITMATGTATPRLFHNLMQCAESPLLAATRWRGVRYLAPPASGLLQKCGILDRPAFACQKSIEQRRRLKNMTPGWPSSIIFQIHYDSVPHVSGVLRWLTVARLANVSNWTTNPSIPETFCGHRMFTNHSPTIKQHYQPFTIHRLHFKCQPSIH